MLILFDIDGTLLLSRGLGVRCMRDAAEELFERPIDTSKASFPGSLDSIIFRDLCRAHDIADHERWHDRFRARYVELMHERMAAEQAAYSLPGVASLVDELARKAGWTLGLLTGNWPETGLLKVAAAGLDPELFPIRAWGDDGPTREDLPPVALQRFAQHSGKSLSPERVVIIGDTPRDVDCAKANDCAALGAATGRYSVADLMGAGADHAFDDLSDVEAVLAWLTEREGAGASTPNGLPEYGLPE